jgi:hypothetical protein
MCSPRLETAWEYEKRLMYSRAVSSAISVQLGPCIQSFRTHPPAPTQHHLFEQGHRSLPGMETTASLRFHTRSGELLVTRFLPQLVDGQRAAVVGPLEMDFPSAPPVECDDATTARMETALGLKPSWVSGSLFLPVYGVD